MTNIRPDSSQNFELPIVDQDEFNLQLKNYYSAHSVNSKKLEWTNKRIQSVIKLLEDYNSAKSIGKRATNKQYHHAHKYDVVNVGNQRVLIMKRKKISQPAVQIIPLEDYYKIILDAHIATGHGRRDKIVQALRHKYMVPIFAIKIFLNLCKTCISNKGISRASKPNGFKTVPVVLKPIVSDEFNKSGQINLVDFQTCPDGEYKWLLQYQDLSTKFCFLRPLKSNLVKEVAVEVLKIFLEVGCPNVLHSCNGLEFTASILKEIIALWPACEVIQGQPIYPPQETLERSHQDISNLIQAWMVDNNSANWSLGCYFVQFQINSSYHLTTENTPYKALFGVDPRLGISSTGSENIVTKLEVEVKVEEDFEDISNSEKEISQNDQEIKEQEKVLQNKNDLYQIGSAFGINDWMPQNDH